MKKALVLSLIMVLGLGVATFAAGLSGNWETTIGFELDSAPSSLTLVFFESSLDIAYDVSGWTFGGFLNFDETGFTDQYFITRGQLGAFKLASLVDFDVDGGAFEAWLTGANVSIAGVTGYGWFLVDDGGSGAIIGAEAQAGEVNFLGEIGFNLSNSAYSFWGNAWDYIAEGFMDPEYAYDPFHGCALIPVWSDYISTQTDSYCTCWSNAYFMVSFPFACVDSVLIDVYFAAPTWSNTTGLNSKIFQSVRAHLMDIALTGIDWLSIDDLRLEWTLTGKSVSRIDMDIKLGSSCITPYFALNPAGGFGDSGFSLTSLELYAFKLGYTWNGVSINAITLLDTDNYIIDWGGYIGRADLAGYGYYCASPYDELFEISYDGAKCCDGGLSFDVKNWFDIGVSATNPELFGWMETDLSATVGIGANFTFGVLMNVSKDHGVELFGFTFGVTF